MIVCKFGGAVLATPEGFPAMASIVSSLRGESVVVVVSALGSSTRLLDAAIDDARSGTMESALRRVAELDDLHRSCVAGLDLDDVTSHSLQVVVQERLTLLIAMLRGISTTRQCTPRMRDRVLSWGEDLSREISARWLEARGLSARSIPSRTVIVTTDEFGCARPLTNETAGHAASVLVPLLEEGHVVVTEGFVGQSTSGDVTTMGRESSNLTATLLGAALGAEMVTIYTDVEGVRSADPHMVPHSDVRVHLSYNQARIAAEAGVKLLYPTMMQPAEHAHVPVRIASAYAPTGASTVIDNQDIPTAPIAVSVDLGNGMHRCTVVYVDTMRFLTTVSQIIASIHDCSPFDVVTDAASQRADVIVPSKHAAAVLDRLHTLLCLEAKQQ